MNFLVTISSRIDLITETFLEFMEFPEYDKRRIRKIINLNKAGKNPHRGKEREGIEEDDYDYEDLSNKTISSRSLSMLIDDGALPDDITLTRKGDINPRAFDKKKIGEISRPHNNACIFFEVSYLKRVLDPRNGYTEYIFQINLKEKPEEQWSIRKRYSDFVQLDNELRKALKVEMPKLPGKLMAPNENDLSERAIGNTFKHHHILL
jgi:hypothetical protein